MRIFFRLPTFLSSKRKVSAWPRSNPLLRQHIGMQPSLQSTHTHWPWTQPTPTCTESYVASRKQAYATAGSILVHAESSAKRGCLESYAVKTYTRGNAAACLWGCLWGRRDTTFLLSPCLSPPPPPLNALPPNALPFQSHTCRGSEGRRAPSQRRRRTAGQRRWRPSPPRAHSTWW